MSEPKQETNSVQSAPEYDVPGILRGRFNALCERVVTDTISALEIYEADDRVDRFGRKIQPCYDLARFDRRNWDERKLEKNLRKFLAYDTSDDFTTVAPYEAELGPDVFFLDIATLDVPREDGSGYTIHLFRLTDEFSVDETGNIVPDIVTYKLSLEPHITASDMLTEAVPA